VSPVHRLLPLLLLCLGCSKLFAKDAPPAEEAKAEAPADDEPAEGEAEEPPAAGHAAATAGGRYGIPFTYERSPEEPLAKARQYMADVLKDNATFSGPSRERAAALAETESPRATVLTCSDSRVQPSVWDSTPENDSYTVRVLGNQLATALPSVEYGVDALGTPVLLIIGHTGCESAASAPATPTKPKAADDHAKGAKASKARGGKEGRSSSRVVIENVNAQVKEAVSHFAARVQSGDLTVIGAVYDVTNELGKGAGRLHLLNINGNVEVARVKAFEDAVNEQNRKATAAATAKRGNTDERARALLDGSARLPPGARATINAVSVVGGGGFDAVGEGGFPKSMLGAPHDVKPAFARRPSTLGFGASRAAEPSAAQGDEHGGVNGHGPSEAPPKMDAHAASDPHATTAPAAKEDAHAAAGSHAADAHAAGEKPQSPEAHGHAEEPAKPKAKGPGGKRKKSKAAEPANAGEPGAEPPPLPWK
jgi:carbonic anhydrase